MHNKKSAFPLVLETPKETMRFIGTLLQDELVRESIKIRIREIEREIKDSNGSK